MARHRTRKRALISDLASAASPADRVFAAAQYLRGTLRQLARSKDSGPELTAAARDAQEYPVELVDRLFEAAIKERRSRR